MHMSLRSLVTLSVALAFLFFTTVFAIPLSASDDDQLLPEQANSIGCSEVPFDAGPKFTKVRSRASKFTSGNNHDRQSLTLGSPQPADFTFDSLNSRDLPHIGSMIFRALQIQIFRPIDDQLKAMGDDLDAAFASFQRALAWIKADHPPLFRISLGYGALQLRFDCPNPMNLETVKSALELATFAYKIFGAALWRGQMWSAYGFAIIVTFGVLPQFRGFQNAING